MTWKATCLAAGLMDILLVRAFGPGAGILAWLLITFVATVTHVCLDQGQD
ncbi:hypothetical protein [Paracoccus sp. IB05]|nr:hypothetical protein [Paracoccus sp. IB05]MBJ2150789.1 hypothetical protein [Paracoccus sp. IB05]